MKRTQKKNLRPPFGLLFDIHPHLLLKPKWLALYPCASGVFLKLMRDLSGATSRTHRHHHHAVATAVVEPPSGWDLASHVVALYVIHAIPSPSPNHFLLLASSAPTQTSTAGGVNQYFHRDCFTKLNNLHTQQQFLNKIEPIKFQRFDLH